MSSIERIVGILESIDFPIGDDLPSALSGGSDLPVSESADIPFLLSRFFTRSDIQKRIIEINTDRLYAEQGDRNYKQLGTYSPYTRKLKKKKNLPYEHFTYYDSGDTYDSLIVVATREGASVKLGEGAPDYAHGLKETAWGLTEDETEQLKDEVLPEVKDIIVNGIKQALING